MSNENVIGYIINETATVEERVRPKFEVIDGRVEFDTNLQDADVKNRNGRFYPSNELFTSFEQQRTKELIRTRNWFGEAGHPMSKDLNRQQTVDPNNRNHLVLKVWREGNMVRGRIRAASTRVGDDFHRTILDGTVPAFSLRALGTVQNTSRGAEVTNLRPIAYDFVIFPSHSSAYGDTVDTTADANKTAMSESALYLTESDSGLLVPLRNKEIISYITEQSKNIKSVIESFELLYDDIVLCENGRQVKLTSKGNTIVVSLEQQIRNEIMDFTSKFKIK